MAVYLTAGHGQWSTKWRLELHSMIIQHYMNSQDYSYVCQQLANYEEYICNMYMPMALNITPLHNRRWWAYVRLCLATGCTQDGIVFKQKALTDQWDLALTADEAVAMPVTIFKRHKLCTAKTYSHTHTHTGVNTETLCMEGASFFEDLKTFWSSNLHPDQVIQPSAMWNYNLNLHTISYSSKIFKLH